jgi:hypothetical protein
VNLIMEGSPLNLPAGNMTAFSLTLFGGIDLAVEAVLVQSCRADAERGGDTAYVEWRFFRCMGFGVHEGVAANLRVHSIAASLTPLGLC